MNTEHTTIYNTTSTAMYIPGNSAEEDDEDEDDTYYSIIPDRAQAMRERWKYIFRRTCFYVFLGTVFGGTIAFPFIITNLTVWFWITYLLWFELDVTVSKNAVSSIHTQTLSTHNITPRIYLLTTLYRYHTHTFVRLLASSAYLTLHIYLEKIRFDSL